METVLKQPRRPYTITGFARASGKSKRKVKRAIELKEIRVVRFAGQDLIPPSEFDRIMEAGGGVPVEEDAPKPPEFAA